MSKIFKKYHIREFLLAFLFILLFVLTSSYGLDFLIWLVNVPLLLLVYNKPLKKAALVASASSVFAVFLSFIWVIEYSLSTYILSSTLFSVFLFSFAIAFNVLSKKIKGYLQVFVAPFVFSILMAAFSFTIINSYWADWAMFHSMAVPLIWYIGSSGITFLIVLMHSIIASYIINKDKKVLATGLILAFVIAGCFVYSYTANPSGKKIKVALLQGHFDKNWDWRSSNAKGLIFDTYENMSIEAAKTNPDIIVWPEYAIADDVLRDLGSIKRISNLAKKTSSYLVIGTLRWQNGFYYGERKRNDIALVFGPDGKLIGEYNSVFPIPFERWVLPGNETNVFAADFGNFGVSLCYEETQKVAKDFSRKGAQFLVSLANNQVLENTAGFYLISLYPNLRAAENGKYLIRATNTGITKIVNPYGKTEAQLEPYKRGILIEDIYLNSNTTFYTKYGNLILNVALVIFGILFFICIKNKSA